MSCNDKITIRCKKVDANCVQYDNILPSFSALDSCVTIAETTGELYNLVGQLKEDIDLSQLDNECLTLPSNITIKNLFQLLITTICIQKTTIDSIQVDLIEAQQAILLLQTNTCP